MPWRIVNAVSQRHEVAELYLSGIFPVETLLESFDISRRTLFYWVNRYERQGLAGLVDRSRRPRHLARSHSLALRECVLASKRAHRTWGPRKLRDFLQRTQPNTAWPAASTIGTWLAAAGMVKHRRRRGARQPVRSSRTPADAPNAVWTIDFKGQFATRDGQLCYPLTVQDTYSRYLLSCQALAHPTWQATRAALHRCFHRYGVPQCLRSDNGPPFASPHSLGRLSRLHVWWIKLGIRPELIRPARPSENGRHERMHRTLKAETAMPPARSLAAQQQRFTAFRREYNRERPHEALGSQVPADCYAPSSQPYRLDPARLAYPAHWQTRRVQSCGTIKWQGRRIFLSEVLSGEPVGLEETAPESWLVYFGPHPLGYFTATECHLHPLNR